MSIDDQLDELFARIDFELVMAGEENIEKVKRELEEANVFDLDPAIVTGYLLCTFPARKTLEPAWTNFWFRAQQYFVEIDGLEQAAKELGHFLNE